MASPSAREAVQNILRHLDSLLHRTEADPRPVVVMTCGVSGAGKTTLSKALLAKYPNFVRLSMDAIIGERHGLYGRDYRPSQLEAFQDEADLIFRSSLDAWLKEGNNDIVLDRAFYAKEDRDEFRAKVEAGDGRVLLIYLKLPTEELWRRIQERRARGVDADSAREINRELLGEFVKGFKAPEGEGEVVFEAV